MTTTRALTCDRGQALAFRIESHHLARRLPPGSLLKAAGACGIQDSPPGSAALAFHARVEGLKPADIDQALSVDRTLLQTMSLRGAPLVYPTADAAVFSAGLLPDDEASLRIFIIGAAESLDRVGMNAIELVTRTSGALKAVLGRRALTKDELGKAIADRISGELKPGQREKWLSASWISPDQYCGESLVRFALYAVALQGLFCYAPRSEGRASFVRTDLWLGTPLPEIAPGKARAELVRRYLHCYGPSTPGHFAEWAGIAPEQADRAWLPITGELAAVDFGGKPAWALESDIPRLQSPVAAAGVRFLPPHEPLLQMRDRATLIPDRSLHKKLWRMVGNPGVVLVDGEPVAAWRARKKGGRLEVTVEAFAGILPKKQEIEAEAGTLAPYRGCASVNVGYEKM